MDEKQRLLGRCPNCDCEEVLYIFARDPELTANGVFVEVTPHRALSSISFFLPFGCVVRDRQEFEKELEEAEWAKISESDIVKVKEEIQVLIGKLNRTTRPFVAKRPRRFLRKVTWQGLRFRM